MNNQGCNCGYIGESEFCPQCGKAMGKIVSNSNDYERIIKYVDNEGRDFGVHAYCNGAVDFVLIKDTRYFHCRRCGLRGKCIS